MFVLVQCHHQSINISHLQIWYKHFLSVIGLRLVVFLFLLLFGFVQGVVLVQWRREVAGRAQGWMGFWFVIKRNGPPTAGAPSLSPATISFTLE